MFDDTGIGATGCGSREHKYARSISFCCPSHLGIHRGPSRKRRRYAFSALQLRLFGRQTNGRSRHTNTIFFACRSDREENHLAIHIPPAIRLNSFADRESRSRLEVRFATDNRQFKIWGEYLDGDINFRAPGDKIAVFNDPEGAFIELREIADVPRLDLEFGREKDSMHFLIGDKLPSGGDVDGAVRKALPEFMKRPSENFHYFSTQAMLAACSKFRKGGGSH
jgi:hypothetical protein